jgi:hypothetical protein
MERQEAIEILEKIKEECSMASDDCSGCIFQEIYSDCPLIGNPQMWDL